MSTALPTDRIRQWLDERERQLQALVAGGQPPESTGPEVTDLKDGAADEAEAEVDDAELALHLAELQQIERARERLASGDYGQCSDCGEPIASARLIAQPTATRCIACQSAAEQHPR
ncbi:TraR/DksA family transcriptional regulator [Ideonella sp.]|uniref:TraR/DksA family transcriptional regulator n=1 Tax=Ideonella sp. TaxID=1929293 RepID=UPI0035B14585